MKIAMPSSNDTKSTRARLSKKLWTASKKLLAPLKMEARATRQGYAALAYRPAPS